uniref:Uncharacterized protein n=1 Tax=Onchocerca volvulus TaxID=6282 RepID=A0A2K6W944_ONCVO
MNIFSPWNMSLIRSFQSLLIHRWMANYQEQSIFSNNNLLHRHMVSVPIMCIFQSFYHLISLFFLLFFCNYSM